MEIKKGISQMPEFLNQEINYVVPSDGKMYYVLKDGILEDGTVIATLDPKYVFDQTISCSTVGAFKEDGSVLIDFDKKEIKQIDKDLLLAVSSKPSSSEVLDALAKENDEISKSMILDNATVITDKLINEMGITGEMLFSDAFSEANVYKTDSYNNKIGIDCSFIGKTSKELYFHTNDVNSESKIVNLGAGVVAPKSDSSMPPDTLTDVSENVESIENESTTITPIVEEVSAISEENGPVVSEITDVDDQSSSEGIKLDIDHDILNGFNSDDVSAINETQEDTPSIVSEEETEDDEVIEKTSDDIEKEMNESSFDSIDSDSVNDEVLDNAIAVMKKMIEETNKLNEKISNLEKEIEEKDKTIEEQESKKSELNTLLDQANEMLEKID
jgi:hypothetical protein